MISRTYVVQMPSGESPATPLDILVQSDPGTTDAPVVAGGTGAYYELRGRPLRIPVLAAQGQSAGFVPRLNLGFSLSLIPLSVAVGGPALPGVQLSASLASLASVDGTIPIPAFADPGGEPVIRLTGSADTLGLFFLLALQVAEGKDEDRSGQASP